MNKTTKNILFGIIGIIIIGLVVYPKLPKEDTAEEVASANAKSTKLTLDAVTVRQESLNNEVNVTGSLLADESVVLNTEVAGKIAQILFEEGENVKKGDVLLKLIDDEVLAEMEKLRYTRKLNQDNERRQKKLLEKEAISREEYETALTTLNTTNAELKVLQTRLDKHYVKAPFDGVIGLRNISEGGYLNPGSEIANLYKVNPMKLEFTIPSKHISLVNIGDPITFQVDAYDETFAGAIYAVEPQIDPETRSIRVRAKTDNAEKKLFPGQFARISLTLETIPDAILVPTESVIPELNGKKIYLYKNGKVESQAITTNIRTADRLQVTSGLQVGDTVLTTGVLQVGSGMEVNVKVK